MVGVPEKGRIALNLKGEIESYIRENWDQVLRDIDALVRIPSVEDLGAAASGAPYGPGPALALREALGMAERMGFETHDCEGFIGYADLPGAAKTQICVLGHVDVVPAGPGWAFPPYEVTCKDGYLIGRGVSDDKGPLVIALHAVNFWREHIQRTDEVLPYTVRMLFGANEETGMGDVAYYSAHYPDPEFLFTPDADFPVGYGEAGICQGVLTSGPIVSGRILALEGGVAVNAVPGEAHARVACDVSALPSREGIVVAVVDGAVEDAAGDAPEGVSEDTAEAQRGETGASKNGVVDICAYGKAAHASAPQLGRNAVALLADYLLENDLLSSDERRFFELVQAATSTVDGAVFGIACADDHLGALTAVGTVAALRQMEGNARLSLAMDFRYPTAIIADEIERRMGEAAANFGATFAVTVDKPPYLIDPSSSAIKALSNAYNEVTGEDAEPFTMKGGTYAREFAHAASFGPEKSWEPKPDWIGALHAADEGIREDLLKQALEIYIRAIGNLMEVEL